MPIAELTAVFALWNKPIDYIARNCALNGASSRQPSIKGYLTGVLGRLNPSWSRKITQPARSKRERLVIKGEYPSLSNNRNMGASHRLLTFLWIPAFAGMTMRGKAPPIWRA
jgi:hypothetical protein